MGATKCINTCMKVAVAINFSRVLWERAETEDSKDQPLIVMGNARFSKAAKGAFYLLTTLFLEATISICL